MKNLFDGMKRAKARTILSVLIVLVMTISVGVCTYMSSSAMMHGRGEYAPNMKMSQNIDSQGTDLNAESTEDSDFTQQTDNKTDNIPENRGKGQNTVWITADVVCVVLGAVLLFSVNFASTKKRKSEFSQILSNGVPFKAIKKQLFLEAFVIVLIAGIVGSGIGVAIAQPVSSTVMSQRMTKDNENANMPEGFEGGRQQGDFNPDNKLDNMPEDFNPDNKSEDMPEGFDPDNKPDNMPERPSDNSQSDDGNSIPQNEFKSDRQSNSAGYIVSAVVAVLSAVIFAVISGVACYLPVSKIKSKENVNE